MVFQFKQINIKKLGIISNMKIVFTILKVTILTIILTSLLVIFDSFETLYKVSRAHENWELDEILLGSLSLIIISLIVAIIAISKLLKEKSGLEKELSFQASHDYLTNLPNRYTFQQSLKVALAQAKRYSNQLAVLFLDLDDFKLINDTLGHNVGDSLLVELSKRLMSTLRTSDLLSRHGGDEFLLLCSNFGEDKNSVQDREMFSEHISYFSQRILRAIQEPLIVDGIVLHINASIGIAVYPDDGLDEMTLLQNSDAAMYEAKAMGKGNYEFYSKDLSQKQKNLMLLINQLHHAITDQNEFILHYQPIINIQTMKIVGVEALIRWKKDGKIIPPGDFIPAAESSGLIQKMGDWIMEKACLQAYEWENSMPLFIAINLSVKQFENKNIAIDILDHIEKSGVSRELIELEVTESAMIKDTQFIEKMLVEFDSKGLSISLDDFGTGYSSLSRLKHLPINKLKIDQSFVSGIPDDCDDVPIVKSIIQMCDSLGISSVAEGIESAEQLAFLQKEGCLYGQGYYFSRPVPADEIEVLWNLNAGSIDK